MLDNQTLEQLRRLRLSGMAAAFAQQLEQPELQTLSFEERFSLLLDRELNLRENRRLTASYNWRVCGNWLVSKTSTTHTAAASSAL
jgi:IstB-like ATP binding protein